MSKNKKKVVQYLHPFDEMHKNVVPFKNISIEKGIEKNYITKKSTYEKYLRTFELRLAAEKFIYSVMRKKCM